VSKRAGPTKPSPHQGGDGGVTTIIVGENSGYTGARKNEKTTSAERIHRKERKGGSVGRITVEKTNKNGSNINYRKETCKALP